MEGIPLIIVISIIGLAFVMLAGGSSFGEAVGNLNATQIAAVAAQAGFSGSDLTLAVAIALAESSGNPAAVGDQSLAPTRGPSIGLWQINTGSSAHPEYAGVDLTDPQTNANAAFSIYTSAGGFTPWSTYKNGISGSLLATAGQGVTTYQQTSEAEES